MSSLEQPKVNYDVAKMKADMAERGWINTDLAREAGVSDMAITRFLRGERQTARMAKKLALALGFSVRRYIVRGSEERVPA